MQGVNIYANEHAITWAIIPIYYMPTGITSVDASSALTGFDPNNTRNYVSIIHDEALKTRIEAGIPETHVPGGLLNGLTEEEEAATTEPRGNLSVHFYNTRTAFQTGEMDIYDDAVWEQYLADCEAYGMSEILEVYQACYDRYLASK